MSDRKLSPAYSEGRQAFHDGLSSTDNPYMSDPDNLTAAYNWNFGWLDALAKRVRENDPR